MQKTFSIKRSILLYIVIAIAVAAFCSAVSFVRPAHAAGNNAGSSAVNSNRVSISLDVNGIDATDGTTRDNDGSLLDQHNGVGFRYRKRYIHYLAVKEKLELPASRYAFDRASIKNSSVCFSVDTENSGDSSQYIVVEALSITENGSAYFSVDLKSTVAGDNSVVTVYFQVSVSDTFVPSNTEVFVGHKINAANNEYYLDAEGNQIEQSSVEGGQHKPILTIYNYSSVTVDLSEYLVGRALYRDAAVIKEIDSLETKWSLKSVENFAIKTVTFEGLPSLQLSGEIKSNSTAGNAAANVPPIRIAPSVTGRIEVDSSTIREYNQNHQGTDFWSVTHIMSMTLEPISTLMGTATESVIKIPFKFEPANPQVKSINSSILRLNVTSENAYNLASGTNLTPEGAEADDPNDYCAIYIRPSDLIEYNAPETYVKSKFSHRNTTLNGSDDLKRQNGLRIDRVKEDLSDDEDINEPNTIPTVYKITALKSNIANSNFAVKFTILYYTGTNVDRDGHSIDVEINLTTYGGYQVKFSPINGKKAVEYNVLNSGVFAEMRERGYLLTDAKTLNEKQLGVTLSNNILKLDPKVKSINGQTTAKVWLEFTNNSRQKISFESEIIDINVDAGSLFARFEDWQAWLIIAACIVGGIMVVLFIVWIFIHSISKHKQDELAMQAPVSSYIVKLNSTIAATQAQQRAAQTQVLSQASTMLLGAGPTGTTAAPPPDTLQLATGMPSTPSSPFMSTPSAPLMSEPQAAIPPDSGENLEELIAKYITDDELLERIFTEKYEPKGMVRRTFFKSKDLQARELEKEKKRIIERYKTPMPMDEAIMSETEINNAGAISTPAAVSEPRESEPQPTEMFVLDFDPESPLYVEEEKPQDEFTEEKIDIDSSPEESRLKAAERRNAILEKELEELQKRLGKVEAEVARAKTLEEDLREKIAKAESDDEQYGKDIEELEFKLASAKNKDKEKITRDIGIKEEKKKRNGEELERLRSELDILLGNSDRINGIYIKLGDLKTAKDAELESVKAEREKAKAEYDAYMERLEQVRKRQELEAKVNSLTPLLEAVNNSDYEMKKLDRISEEQNKERESLKSEVAAAKAQILGATDFGVIADLNARISDANGRLSELEREITQTTKQKSDLHIEFNSQRRKANDYCEKNEIPVDEVVKAEDAVIGNIEFELAKASREQYKDDAEKAVATAQAVYDDLSASSNDVTMIAMEVAANIKDIEDEIESTKAELDAINLQMEEAGEDERLMLMVDQGDKSDRIEELKKQLEQVNVDGTKRKMEAQSEFDSRLEEARTALDSANAEFHKSCTSFDDFVNNTDPLDLITSGSGVISKDQKKIEAENLKKQLERSKNEIEQARLAAQQAQMEAEEARRKAQEESEEARLEAERLAQEAIERAEQARLEAEEKARADIEAAEQARLEAEQALAAEAEEARRKAEEEAEEAKRKAQEESEEAKRLAEEQAEEARRKAEEEAEEAKRKAQEEIEEMKRKAEEEAEAKRLEEENKRKEEEARQKAEAERNDAIAKKVAVRKDQIIAIRNEMKELKNDVDAKNLRERLYNLQLTYDEDERDSTELMDFYNKTMDDIQNSGEIARLKAENAKKPQRVVRKVTERVNRIPKRKAGARPGARRPGARPAARPGARPASARPGARRPAARPGTRPGGSRPGARPGGRPTKPRQ